MWDTKDVESGVWQLISLGLVVRGLWIHRGLHILGEWEIDPASEQGSGEKRNKSLGREDDKLQFRVVEKSVLTQFIWF